MTVSSAACRRRAGARPTSTDAPGTHVDARPATGSLDEPIGILQVSTYDLIGGAERDAWNLFHAYRDRGLGSWLAVGRRLGEDRDVLAIPRDAAIGWRLRIAKEIDRQRGVEDFRFPGTSRLLELPPRRPDVVHGHNLHGDYFDLRELAPLSGEVPVVLTLHDAWLLSGHCAHSLDCERWLTGCGRCPDLRLDPPVLRDATAHNWRRKAAIYSRSRLHVATPSRWLMDKVERSMLARAIVEARVIPNGVDLSVFRPGNRVEVRAQLGLPADAIVLLFAATVARHNPWKDFGTLREAIRLAAEHDAGPPIVFLALGEEGPVERLGRAELRPVAYVGDPARVAAYLQAADVYVHATRADTFPNTVIEALACGTPVVATAVGGVPEQIEDGRTGLLVEPADPAAMAGSLSRLVTDEDLRQRLSQAAANVAMQRFDLERQADSYLGWYRELLQRRPVAAARHS